MQKNHSVIYELQLWNFNHGHCTVLHSPEQEGFGQVWLHLCVLLVVQLPPTDIHVRLIGDSNLAIAVDVRVCACLVFLWWTGNLSRVCLSTHSKSAGIGRSPCTILSLISVKKMDGWMTFLNLNQTQDNTSFSITMLHNPTTQSSGKMNLHHPLQLTYILTYSKITAFPSLERLNKKNILNIIWQHLYSHKLIHKAN